MQLTYNAVLFHSIGTVSLMGEDVQYEPAEGAQIAAKRLEFRIDVWNQSFADNRAKLQEILTALKVQNGVLVCVQDALSETGVAVTLYNQTARIISHNFPQDVNEWGTTHQQIRIVFGISQHDLDAQNIACTFTPTGGSLLNLGNVFGWKEGLRVSRFDERRSIRSRSEGDVTVRGYFLGDMSLTLANRRAALITLKESWINAMDSKDGTLTYQDFSKVCRVTELSIDVDEAVEKLVWQFGATYTRFPNESGYAGADYEVNTRYNNDDGEQILTLSGKIMAESENRAQAKLISIRTAVLATANYSVSKQISAEAKARTVVMSSFDGVTDVGDGESFIELSFSEEYKRKNPDHLSWNLSISDDNDDERGLVVRTYSGSVFCGYNADGSGDGIESNTTYEYARYIAILKARELGENKHDYRIRGSFKVDDRLTTKNGFRELVKLDFSFTYQIRGSRLHAELRSETQYNTFGEDTKTVSGFIVGGEQSELDELYQTLRGETVDGGSVVRSESVSYSEYRLQAGDYPGPSTQYDDVNSLTQNWLFNATSGYTQLLHRLDFSFAIWSPKIEGSCAIKYGMRVSKDFTKLLKTTAVQGSLFGTESIIDDALNYVDLNKLDTLLGLLALGTSLTSERAVDREWSVNLGNTIGKTMKLDFSETFESKITGDDSVIDCEISEEIQHTGNRNVIIDLPDAPSIVQVIGTVSGRRTVSGSVTCANETAGRVWIKRMSTLPFPTASGTTGVPAVPSVTYAEPPKIGVSANFPRFIDGDFRGSDAARAPNLVRLTFSFVEILTDYPYV